MEFFQSLEILLKLFYCTTLLVSSSDFLLECISVKQQKRKNMINIEGVVWLYAKVSDTLLQDTCSYPRAEITVVLASGFGELCRLRVPVFRWFKFTL